jgi:hypothetical protein
LSKITVAKKQSLAVSQAKNSLRTVSYENGFHFYTGIGKYSGLTATSLSEFVDKLQKVSADSAVFHFRRGDFQKWFRNVIGDELVAKRVDQLQGWSDSSAENLRKDIVKALEIRIAELRLIP